MFTNLARPLHGKHGPGGLVAKGPLILEIKPGGWKIEAIFLLFSDSLRSR
jgi:hypothetical protein